MKTGHLKRRNLILTRKSELENIVYYRASDFKLDKFMTVKVPLLRRKYPSKEEFYIS